MKSILCSIIMILLVLVVHSQTLAYTDTIVTPLGNFMLETNEEQTSQTSYSEQTQVSEDGGYSEQLNFYPSGSRLALSTNNESLFFTLNPNPTADNATLFLTNGGPELTINIKDISGRIVSVQTFYSMDGTYQRTIELSGFSSGVYFIEMGTNNQRYSQLLVRQ